MAENDEGPIRRAKKPAKTEAPAAPAPAPSQPAPAPAPPPSAPEPAPRAAAPAPEPEPVVARAPAPPVEDGHAHTNGSCASCTRLRAALRSARQRLRRLAQENKTLREELLSAGEMIENLAQDLEKPY